MTSPRLLVVCTQEIGALLLARWQAQSPQATFHFAASDALTGAIGPADGVLLVQQTLSASRHVAASTSLPCIDIALHTSPLATQFGFMLAAGGNRDALDLALPLIDALAPAPGAWLHSGGPGSASFCAEVAQSLFNSQNTPLLMAIIRQLQVTPQSLDNSQEDVLGAMRDYVNEQTQCARTLQQLAKHYLASSPDCEAPFTAHHSQTRCFGLNAADNALAPATQLAHLLLHPLPEM